MNKSSPFNDQYDLIYIIKTLLNNKRVITGIVIFFLLFGIFIHFSSERKWTSNVIILPKSNGVAPSSNGLSGIASLAGINIGANSSSNVFPASLYERLKYSSEFLRDLSKTELSNYSSQETFTYIDYYSNQYKPSLLSKIKKYTVGLPNTVIGAIKESKSDDKKNESFKLEIITEFEKPYFDLLAQQLSISPNMEEGYVQVMFEMPDPYLAALMLESSLELIQKYIIRYNTNNALNMLRFIEARYKETERDFLTSQAKLASFQDQNVGLSSARARSELQKLQSEYDLNYNIYLELAKEYEQAKAQVKKDTPAFSLINPVTVPYSKSNRKFFFTIFSFFLTGLFVSVSFIFLKEYINYINIKIQNRSFE